MNESWPEIECAEALIAICRESGDSIGLVSWSGHIKPILDEYFSFKEKPAVCIRFMEMIAHSVTHPAMAKAPRALTLCIAGDIALAMWALDAKPRAAVKVPEY